MKENKKFITNHRIELTNRRRQRYQEYIDNLYSPIFEKIQLDAKDIKNNKILFPRGIKETTFISGLLNTLISTGVTPELAMDYVLNMEV